MVQTVEAVYENGILRPLSGVAMLKEGQRALVTVIPIPSLDPEEHDRRHAELLRLMEAAGMIEHLQPPVEPKPADWRPLVLPGEPLSETVVRMRQEG